MMRRVTVLLGPIVLSALGCGVVIGTSTEEIRGSGMVTSEVIEIDDFDELVLGGEGTAIVTIGIDPSLTITTDDNLHEHIIVRVVDRRLVIRTEDDIDIDPTGGVTYAIGVPVLTGAELSGAGSVTAARVSADSFTARLSGAGQMEVERLEADSLDVSLSGAGAIRVAGSVTDQVVEISGAGEYEAGDLASRTATVDISGAGGAVMWVEDRLDAELSGVGSLGYHGSPTVTSDVSGVGRITDLGEK